MTERDSEAEDDDQRYRHGGVDIKWTPCVVHTLQPYCVWETLLDDNIQELLKQAEEYVVQSTQSHTQHEDQPEDDGEENDKEPEEVEPAQSSSKQPVFRFFSKSRMKPKQRNYSTSSMKQQIRKYKEELSHPITCDTATGFWLEKSDTFYHSLKLFALDLLAMPASQVFADRVRSVTDDLTRGRHNRASWHEVLSLKWIEPNKSVVYTDNTYAHFMVLIVFSVINAIAPYINETIT